MMILFLVQMLPFLLNNNEAHGRSPNETPRQTNVINRVKNIDSNPRSATHRYSASYTVSTDDLPWKTLALTFCVFFVVIFALLTVSLNQYRIWLRSRYENMAQNIEERQAREMQDPQQPRPAAPPGQPQQPRLNPLQQQERDSYERSSRYWLAMGLASGLVCGIFVWGMFFNNVDDPAQAQKLSEFAMFLGSVLQFGGFVWMMTRSFCDARRQQQHQQYPQNQPNPAKMASIVAKIRDLPIEMFVPNDEEAYSKLKISQLKHMIQNRGGGTASYLEKNEMVSCLMDMRKYDDSCCICYEDYHDEHMLRILPSCGHEFHLECLDQWAYTFERKAEAPCCPLCKTEF